LFYQWSEKMKVQTRLHAGECPKTWYAGTVEGASGGGFYGSIRQDDGTLRYFNQGYTSFCPNGQGLKVGQRVLFAPNTEPGERYGKVFCVTNLPCKS
jgi:hypothetical protein